jgi:hypothetical protein
MSSLSHWILVRFFRLVRPPIKNLIFYQNLLVWSISSISLDLCDHVKPFIIDKRRWIVDYESFIMGYHSMWSWAKFSLNQFSDLSQANQFLDSPLLFPQDLIPLQNLSSPRPNISWRMKNSHGYLSQNSFFERLSSFVGNIIKIGFHPLLSSVSRLTSFSNILKRTWASKRIFSAVQSKPDSPVLETRWSGFWVFNLYPGETYPFNSHFFPTVKNTRRRALKTIGGDFLIPP